MLFDGADEMAEWIVPAEWIAAADARDLDKIFLVAPSSTDERIAMTTAACRGFVYATAVMGVTGARTTTSDLAGPLGFTGTLAFTGEPGYVIDGKVTTRADTPPALARQIAFLGTPDAQGRRPFSIAGTY